ncbi:MAG: hypothetical protein M1347_05095 [Chloroflexi bacterium]|nr:hypothetical protein [Chloroflexota bacterium]
MRIHLFTRMAAIIVFSLVLAACGGTAGGPSAAELAATQQSLEATQQALNAQPKPTSQPAPTSEPTAEPPTAEPPADTEVPVVEAQPYFTEEFDEAPANWTYELINGDDVDFDLYAEGGKLIFDIQGENIWSYLTYDSYTYTDVRVDARAENLGNNNNNVSLICRYNDRGWYEFNVANNGLYTILRYERSTGNFATLYSGGVANLKTGKATNDYTIVCQGERLTLGVNGTEIRTIKDSLYDEGLIGVSVSSFDGIPVLVEFDYVSISTP